MMYLEFDKIQSSIHQASKVSSFGFPTAAVATGDTFS